MAADTQSTKGRLHGLLGYDVFISYTRRDGREYARALATRLRREHDLVVYLDDHELDAGEQLETLLRAVSRSRMLVLLATPKIAQSEYVPREIAKARQCGRRIVPIDVDTTLRRGQHGEALAQVLGDEKWTSESNSLAQGPSDEVVLAIANSGSGLRRRVQQRWLIGVVAAVVFTLAGAAWFFSKKQDDAAASERAARASEAVKAEHTRRLALAKQLQNARELSTHDPSGALRLLDDASVFPEATRDLTWRLLRADCDWTLWRSPESWGELAAVDFLDDGRIVAVDRAGVVRVVDIASGVERIALQPASEMELLALDAHARVVAMRGESGGVAVHSIDDGRLIGTIEPDAAHRDVPESARSRSKVITAAFLDSGASLATLSATAVRFWRVADGSEIVARRFDVPRPGDDGPSDRLLELHADARETGTVLVGVTTDWEDGHYGSGCFRLRDGVEPLEVVTVRGARSSGLALSRDGAFSVASTTWDGEVSTNNGRLSVELRGSSDAMEGTRLDLGRRALVASAYNAAQRMLVLGLVDGTVQVVDATDRRTRFEWTGAREPSTRLKLDAPATRLAVLTKSGKAEVLGIAAPQRRVVSPKAGYTSTDVRVLARLNDELIALGWRGPDADAGSGLALIDAEDCTLCKLRADEDVFLTAEIHSDGEPPHLAHYRTVVDTSLVALPGGRRLARPSSAGFEIIDMDSPREAAPPMKSDPPVEQLIAASRLALDSAGERYAVVRLSQEAKDAHEYWDSAWRAIEGPWVLELGALRVGDLPRELWSGNCGAPCIEFSQSGRRIAFADGVGAARIFDVASGASVAESSHARRAVRVAFKSQSDDLVVLSEDSTHVLALEIVRASQPLESIAIDAHGAVELVLVGSERAIVGASDGTVAVIDFERRDVQIARDASNSPVCALELSHDERSLLVTRMSAAGRTRCALADPYFGHDVLELSIGDAPVLGAAFLAGDAGLLLIGADLSLRSWSTGGH